MPADGTSNITAPLPGVEGAHDVAARDQLFELAEADLTRIASGALARMRSLHNKVEPRELVSEFYLRIADHPAFWENRHKFYAMLMDEGRAIEGDEAAVPNTPGSTVERLSGRTCLFLLKGRRIRVPSRPAAPHG